MNEEAENDITDNLSHLSYLWDGSQPSWQIIPAESEGYFVEIEFGSQGVTTHDIPAIKEFCKQFAELSNEQLIDKLRDCQEIGIGQLLNQIEFQRLLHLQSLGDFRLVVVTIMPCELMIRNTQIGYFNWSHHWGYRREIITRMISAGVPVLKQDSE